MRLPLGKGQTFVCACVRVFVFLAIRLNDPPPAVLLLKVKQLHELIRVCVMMNAMERADYTVVH